MELIHKFRKKKKHENVTICKSFRLSCGNSRENKSHENVAPHIKPAHLGK